MAPAIRSRFALYGLINLAFMLLAGLACGIGGFQNPRLLYLVLLFALSSTVIVDLDGLNGRYSLLAVFMLVYFISFGAADLTNLLTGSGAAGVASIRSNPFLSPAETLILVGCLMLVLGYRAAVLVLSAPRSMSTPKDWSKETILVVGSILWLIGTIATYRWQVYIVPDTNDEAFRRGLASISPLVTVVYLLAQMCQPVGILLFAYVFCLFRGPFLLGALLTICVVQIVIGFIADIKGLAMLGMILVILTTTLLKGRLPIAWLVVGVLFVTLIYPFFTAYRTAIHGAGISRTTVIANFEEILRKTVAAKDRVNSGRERAQTFLERSSLKANVEIIVAKAGNGVAFQEGYTILPILEAFVPKIIWSQKVRIPVGQFFNKQFRIVEGDEVYISPSHLGELYWNFGWSGVVLGMAVIGAICGWIGAAYNLAEFRSVTRVLVTVITIKQLIVSFESSISDCYVVWLRSLVGIALLHVAFARIRASSVLRSVGSDPDRLTTAEATLDGQRPFANLLT